MEHTEQSGNSSRTPIPFGISRDARSLWPSLRNWTLFLAVSCFLGAGTFICFGIAMLFATKNIARTNNYQTAPDPGLILGIYGSFVVVFVLLGLLLLWVSNNVQQANQHGRPEYIQRLSGSTLRYFRVVGVFGILGFLFQIWWLARLLSI